MSHLFTLQLNQLILNAKLGVFEWEREAAREFKVDINLLISADAEIAKDDLAATLDYAQVESFIIIHAASQEWQLIERLITSITHHLIQQFSRIQMVDITFYKPQALEQCDIAVCYQQSR